MKAEQNLELKEREILIPKTRILRLLQEIEEIAKDEFVTDLSLSSYPHDSATITVCTASAQGNYPEPEPVVGEDTTAPVKEEKVTS